MINKASSVEIEVQKICFLFKSLWSMWTGGVVPNSSDVWSLSRCLAAAQLTSPAGQRKFPGPGPQETE